MKKATIALLAGVTSGIKIQETSEVQESLELEKYYCVPRKDSDAAFHHIDTNHNHKLGPRELYGAIKHWASETHRHLNDT